MINIAICDDKIEDINIIRKYVTEYIKSTKALSEISAFTSGEALMESDIKFDIVFLDIAMHGINGIQAGRYLKGINKNVKIIYITDFTEYWMQAINNVHAFAYLKKLLKSWIFPIK